MARFNQQAKTYNWKALKTYELKHVASPGSFQMDILLDKVFDQVNEETEKNAWLILVNVSTRKMYVHFLGDKDEGPKAASTVKNALVHIIEKIRSGGKNIKNIRCDGEKAFQSKIVLEYLRDEGIKVGIVPINDGHVHHTALAILDRAVRTLRDYAGKAALKQSTIQEYVDNYNKHYHRGINSTPNGIEKVTIKRHREKLKNYNNKIKKKPGYELKVGDRVDAKKSEDVKKKSEHDRFPYYPSATVTGKQGSYFILKTLNGKIIKKPRSELYKLDPNDVRKSGIYLTTDSITNKPKPPPPKAHKFKLSTASITNKPATTMTTRSKTAAVKQVTGTSMTTRSRAKK
jgi:hypothetical protein